MPFDMYIRTHIHNVCTCANVRPKGVIIKIIIINGLYRYKETYTDRAMTFYTYIHTYIHACMHNVCMYA